MKKLKDFKLKSKKVLVRCDFNVPIKNGRILDDFRIKSTIPTIKYLLSNGAKVILMSHLGRPKDRERNLSLRPVAKRLEKLLKRKIKFLEDCLGEKVKEEIEKMRDAGIVLLENLRFYKEEEEGDKNFAKQLAELGDFFVEDAFAACHRPHASIVGLIKYIPSAAGLLLEKEIKNLKKIIERPKPPLIAIFGGREVDAKVIDSISKIANFVLVGYLIEKQIEKNKINLKYSEKILFPVDGVDKRGENLDIGPQTIKLFKEKILKAKTIFWSGPLGKIEEKKFQKGTREIAKAIIKSRAFSVVGGGETIDFINNLDWGRRFNHLSTGGSAMLDFLSDKKLPGVEVLK